LPGNVAGLVLRFVALLSEVVPLRLVEQGAALLLACLPLFFVPLAVGLGSTAQLTASSGLAILLILSGSAAVGFAVTGRVAQGVARSQTRSLAATRSSNVHVDADCC
jgi:holin-like protein